MSQHPRHTTVIGKYNFSRRVVDHRIPYDLNHASTSTNLKIFYGSWKQKVIANFLGHFGPFVTVWSVVVVGGFVFYDLYHQRSLLDGQYVPSAARDSNLVGMNYIGNRGNMKTDLGRWNHNFACFERQPNCGRDFDWIYKNPNASQ